MEFRRDSLSQRCSLVSGIGAKGSPHGTGTGKGREETKCGYTDQARNDPVRSGTARGTGAQVG